MKAKNIAWDIDYDDGYVALGNMRYEDAADVLELSKDRYANMTTQEREAYAFDVFKHSPDTLRDLVGLPDEVEIPESVSEDEVEDWLSDEYGHCHAGFELQ